jgi:hypothetical protein
MKDKKHYSIEGIKNLVGLKSKMNKARSFKEKFDFA